MKIFQKALTRSVIVVGEKGFIGNSRIPFALARVDPLEKGDS